MEMLRLIERFRRYERIVASYPDPVGELALIKAEFWVAARVALDCLPVLPNQRCGTRLGKRSGPPAALIDERSNQNMQFYGRTSEIRREKWGRKFGWRWIAVVPRQRR
jgi:hypothetical protein